MIDGLPDVPPALMILLDELADIKSVDALHARIKKLLKELRDQSEIFEVESATRLDDSAHKNSFNVHLAGAMNLLSGSGCSDLECRVATADRIARSVCLIADCVWLTDTFSGHFCNVSKLDRSALNTIVSDLLVLRRLEPLIRAGVVRFRSPYVPICPHCVREFKSIVSASAADLARDFASDFHVTKVAGGYKVETGSSHDPPTVYYSNFSSSSRAPRRSEFAKKWIRSELHSSLWVAREASLTGGAVFSNSRIGLAGLAQQSGRVVDKRTLAFLDRERELTIPWVSHLSASQIVELRSEASAALPAFREKICRAMTLEDDKSKPASIISDLREQAEEVRSELNAKRKNAAQRWKCTYGVLGLGLSIYGVASDQVVPGIGGLLPVLQLLIGHKTGIESDVSKLLSKPGFVLVKAQDILAHAR